MITNTTELSDEELEDIAGGNGCGGSCIGDSKFYGGLVQPQNLDLLF
jgi:hypothetical protein